MSFNPDEQVAGHIHSIAERIGAAGGSLVDAIQNRGPVAEQFDADKQVKEQELYEKARSQYHLTDGQARLYAALQANASLGGEVDIGSQRWQELTDGVRNEFKYIDTDTNTVQYMDRGKELAEKQIELITEAAMLGEKHGGGHITAVSGFNEATGRVDVKGVPYDGISGGSGWGVKPPH